MLSPRYTTPEGLKTNFFERVAGQPLRYATLIPPKPQALVCIFPGLSEYIEKYHETIKDLFNRNMAVAIFEWKGQGLSFRPAPQHLRLSQGFEHDLADAHFWLSHLNKTYPALSPLPRLALSHSMGAHLTLRLLQTHRTLFNSCALIAPMQGIAEVPNALQAPANLIARLMPPTRILPGTTHAWDNASIDKKLKILTSDADNLNMQKHFLTTQPALRMGTLTYSWLSAALASMRASNSPKFLQNIQTPILLAIAQNDQIISNSAILKAASHIKAPLTLHTAPHSEHEILMETPQIRRDFWHAFDHHIAKTL